MLYKSHLLPMNYSGCSILLKFAKFLCSIFAHYSAMTKLETKLSTFTETKLYPNAPFDWKVIYKTKGGRAKLFYDEDCKGNEYKGECSFYSQICGFDDLLGIKWKHTFFHQPVVQFFPFQFSQ